MAKSPNTTGAADAMPAELEALIASHAAEVADLKGQLADALGELDAHKGWLAESVRAVADLEAERARQHEIIKALHERLTAAPAAPVAEPKVLMAPNAKKYGE